MSAATAVWRLEEGAFVLYEEHAGQDTKGKWTGYNVYGLKKFYIQPGSEMVVKDAVVKLVTDLKDDPRAAYLGITRSTAIVLNLAGLLPWQSFMNATEIEKDILILKNVQIGDVNLTLQIVNTADHREGIYSHQRVRIKPLVV